MAALALGHWALLGMRDTAALGTGTGAAMGDSAMQPCQGQVAPSHATASTALCQDPLSVGADKGHPSAPSPWGWCQPVPVPGVPRGLGGGGNWHWSSSAPGGTAGTGGSIGWTPGSGSAVTALSPLLLRPGKSLCRTAVTLRRNHLGAGRAQPGAGRAGGSRGAVIAVIERGLGHRCRAGSTQLAPGTGWVAGAQGWGLRGMEWPHPVSQLRVLQVLPEQPGSAGVPASLRGSSSPCPRVPSPACVSLSPVSAQTRVPTAVSLHRGGTSQAMGMALSQGRRQ